MGTFPPKADYVPTLIGIPVIAKINAAFGHKMYYVYVLRSRKNQSFYIGATSNLKQRFYEHNTGRSKATRVGAPYDLIFYEAFLNKSDALNREEYLKSGYGRRTLRKMLRNCLVG